MCLHAKRRNFLTSQQETKQFRRTRRIRRRIHFQIANLSSFRNSLNHRPIDGVRTTTTTHMYKKRFVFHTVILTQQSMLHRQSRFKPVYSHIVSLLDVMVVKLCSEQHRLFCFTEMQVISVTARYPVTLSRVRLRSSSTDYRTNI